jgi:U4/U6.U5 tri-snRNP-associated protein 1
MDIDATNKIRLAIGLPPLPGGGPTFKPSHESDSSSEEEEQGSTLESRAAEGYGNWKKLQESAEAKAKREAKLEAIKKARDAAQKNVHLEGKGLGEADESTELDTKSWLIQQKKRQKRLAREREKAEKLEAELRAREEAVQYTGKDLAGVKVAHEVDAFEDGNEQVLVLKDTTIEENEEEGDELENLEIRERERLGERLDLKKKKPVYDPNDVEEDGKTVLLKQYDEAIEGKKRKRFTLDETGSTVEAKETSKQTVGESLKRQAISLDFLSEVPKSDYADASEIKIKKPKKKKQKIRQKPTDDEDIFPLEPATNGTEAKVDAMELDQNSAVAAIAPSRSRDQELSLVDDDELQAALAKQRREALKNRKKLKPEDIAKQMKEEDSAMANDEPVEDVGLVIDETSEFVANLQRPRTPERSRRGPSAKPTAMVKGKSMSPSGIDEDGDLEMGRSYNDVEDEDDLAARLKREDSTPAPPGLTVNGLDEEATLNQGIGSTLALLSQRGLIKKNIEGDPNAVLRERQKFLIEKQKREAAAEQKARIQRERDRASGKLDRMSAREREEHARWENKQRDQAESRQMMDIFARDYKPDVQLKYVDEFGRSMNQKEAFKHLSHQFHGKGSGKQKTEKHLKKIAEEKKKEAQSALDSSQATGLNNALGTTAKKNKQIGVRLA